MEHQAASSKPMTGPVISPAALALLNSTDNAPPVRQFAAPVMAPGVLPPGTKSCLTMDSATATYGYLNSDPVMCGMGFPGYPYLSNLAQRSEYRAPTEVIAGEMTREWGHFTGVKGAKLDELQKAFEDFGVRECIRLVLEHDGLFGRGQLFINVKGQDSDRRRAQPLLIDDEGRAGIAKGSLLGFKPVEPIWCTPFAYNSNDPTLPDFYKPEAWYIVGRRTHATRLLSFISRPVPDILKPAYNFGGLSLSQLIEPYVVRWLKTVDSVNRLISNFSIISLSTNLLSALSDGGDANGLFNRLAVFNKMRDNRGIFALDKDGEELDSIAVPLGGLSELQAQAQEHMAAPTHIPLVKLTGITPSGLNASSDGEIKVFYDWIAAAQQNDIMPHLRTILRAVQLHLWGKVDPAIGFEFAPLDTPTDKEMAEMRKSDGERDGSYVEKGIVSPDEVRQRLRDDPHSGYTFISGDAPPSPLEAEAAIAEEGKDKDQQRGQEDAEQQHRRELEKAKRATDAWEESKHPRDKNGKFGSGEGGPDTTHLVALQTRLTHEKQRYEKDKSEIRKVWIAQIEKEISHEMKHLGINENVPDMTDEDLLRALMLRALMED